MISLALLSKGNRLKLSRLAAYVAVLAQCAQLSWTGFPVVTPPPLPLVVSAPSTIAVPTNRNQHERIPVTEPALPQAAAEEGAEGAYEVPRESLLTGETTTVLISGETGGCVTLGDASIEIPPGALTEDTEITIQRLLASGETGELRNATAGGGGYRFLPAGQEFLVEAEIRLPYEAVLAGSSGTLEGITTYYYDTGSRHWEKLRRIGVDEVRRQVVSGTHHFTDMINGTLSVPEGVEPLSFNINSIKGLEAGNPSAGVPALEGLSGNYTGGAQVRLGLAVPVGRGGMTPVVGVVYSSDGGNGVMGKGWRLEAGGEITYDTRRGLPEYEGAEGRNGRFMLDGVVLEKAGGMTTPYRYRAGQESGFERVLHYRWGGEDYWEVTEKDGTVRTYGKGGAAGAYGGSWAGSGPGRKNRWLLERVEDRHGNRIRYEYREDSGEIYLGDIYYTETGEEQDGAYRIHFEYNEDIREDVGVNGRGRYAAWLRWRLDRIELRYAGELIRSYRAEYINDRDAEEALWLYGVTRLCAFGEEDGERGPYRWSYEFGYQGFERDEEGRRELYGEVEYWRTGGPVQEQRGKSGGGSVYGSAGAGIGAGELSTDVRVIFAGHFSAAEGETETEWTLVDVNGDGKPDRVRVVGNGVAVYVNTGRGFSDTAEYWEFRGGEGPAALGKEGQETHSYGYSVYGGLSSKYFSAGAAYARTEQKSWSREGVSFADVTGNGLADVVEGGKEYYWRNTGDGFELEWYRLAAGAEGLPGDVERELGDKEIREYDEVWYQEAPLRQWRIPISGTVEVRQEVRAAGTKVTAEGVRAYGYRGGVEEPFFLERITEGVRYASGTAEQELEAGQSLYFVSDAGNDIRSDGQASSDIIWNIRIGYKKIRYFEAIDRSKDVEKTISGERFTIPGVVSLEGFRALQGAAEKLEKGRPRGAAEPGNYDPTPLEALFGYYRYDAGREGYYVNEPGKAAADREDGLAGHHVGASWGTIEARMLEIVRELLAEERAALYTAALAGRAGRTYPLREDTGRWYYGEQGEQVPGYDGGRVWRRDAFSY